jgi:GT2 family glycosyltransferase
MPDVLTGRSPAGPASPPPPAAPLRLAIGIPTRGRPDVLAETLREIATQTRRPDRVVVCATAPADVETASGPPAEAELLFTASGLPRQRNAILDHVQDCDILLFLDDDFLMAPDYVAVTLAAFAAHPDLVVTTGWLIADDSRGPGLSAEAGRALLAADPPGAPATVERAEYGYGCNMALRMATVRAHAERFDERLPLYAWSEDMDFNYRLARFGWIAKLHGARGVHLATKTGRTPGRRLGYSQVANPIYLFRKGSYSFGRAARSVGRNLLANAAKSVQPEPYVDRRGRLWGNMLGFVDLARGRLAPERILDL